MIVRRHPPLHLTYCLNVHPGETWEENLAAIRRHALAVRDRVAPGRPFGLGLRLSHAAADQLGRPGPMAAFRSFLKEHNLYVFTINGFSYGEFHGTSVKERVYAPDWRFAERLEYTKRLADILAGILPDGTVGSVSTVPGSYRAWVRSDADVEPLVRNLAECAAYFSRVETATGRRIVLALEPEPDCLFDTTAGTIEFFHTTLASHPAMDRAGADWRRYLGVCLDTCHASVQFETPLASLTALRDAGIEIPKVQLSAAPSAPAGAAAASRLAAFAEETYLHQVRWRRADGSTAAWPDLSRAALDAVARDEGGDVRVHMHVPLYVRDARGLRSTAADLSPEFFRALLDARIPHLEIETYTWNVLPRDLAALPVEESIAKEYRWVLDRLPRVAR